MKSFDYSIFIGRFQPVHKGHLTLIQAALEKAENVIIVIGSANKAPDIKNPWSAYQREAMIRLSLSDEENARVHCFANNDHLYNDTMWLAETQRKVAELTNDSENIALIGHEHDASSYYLKLFPQWTLVAMPNIDEFPHATDIRRLYFTHDVVYKNFVTDSVASYMEKFKSTQQFQALKSEFDFLNEYTRSWEGAPFKPTFVTVDAVTVKSGHILLVRRKGKLGKGLLALPGGFLNQDETAQEGALRELKEETAIKLSKDELRKAVKDSKVFDLPNRSLRGRTISHVFLINLGSGPLDKVKGSDDAEKAFWLPISEAIQRADEFFEDHCHIISYFCARF